MMGSSRLLYLRFHALCFFRNGYSYGDLLLLSLDDLGSTPHFRLGLQSGFVDD